MNKKTRELVYQMYGGHCGYCGCELKTIRDMQVDHIEPKRRELKFVTKGYTKKLVSIDNFDEEKDTMENYMSSCRACNIRKGSMTIEQFRNQLLHLQERLKTQSGSKSNYNAALQYGLIEEKENKVEFYFEKYTNN